MQVPICDPKLEYFALKNEIDNAIQKVLEKGQYILGANVAAFEAEIASYLGCKYAVGVNSGTDALHLALRALNIGPGDEVITTPFTFIATTEAIGMVGAAPVFVDIDPLTFNIDPNCIEHAITPKTKAILPVHLYGQPCAMDAIMDLANRHGLLVVEDCAQAIGASYEGEKVGAIGSVGCFSFFPSKNLGCFGDGGLVVTDDVNTYERLEVLRRHGGKVKYHHDELGLNSRLDEVQAAVLRIKLKYLDDWNDARRRRAYRYNELLSGVPDTTCPIELGRNAPTTSVDEENLRLSAVYHQYTVLIEEREETVKQMRSKGIGNAVYYPVPLHLQTVHQGLGYQRNDFPHVETAAQRCLSLPMFPMLTDSQQRTVVEEFFAGDPAAGAGTGLLLG